MRRFHVPQFIDVEDKIFGPFTLKQFIYTLGGFAVAFIMWAFLPKVIAVIIGLPIIIFTLALAFYKVDRQPFINVVTSAVGYASHSRLYIWKKEEKKIKAKKTKEELEAQAVGLNVPKVTHGKLKDLAWSLDLKKDIKEREK